MGQQTAERTWVLDGGAGWRADVGGQLVLDAEGTLTLRSLPGRAERFAQAVQEARTWVCPADLAGDRRGRLFVLDASTSVVSRLVVASGAAADVVRVDPLPTIGGVGVRARRFRDPRGIAILPSGAVAVADTGNHRVQIFSPTPYALLKVWGATDALGQPVAGSGAREFRSPWALAADPAGTLYVADRGNGRIQRIRADGSSLPDLRPAAAGWDPTHLAIAPDGTLAVVDPGDPATVTDGRRPAAVWVFSPERLLPRVLTEELEHATSVAYGPHGALYVGDAIGRIHVLVAEPGGGYTRVGSGVTGLDRAILDILWWDARPPRLLVLVRQDADGTRRRVWQVDPASGRAVEGLFRSGPLDSRIERCPWYRVRLDASVPAGTSVEIHTFTSETETDVPPATPDSEGPATPDSGGWVRGVLAGADNPDCLVQSDPGRYLWLLVTLRSNGRQAPVLRRATVSYPRVGYLEYLPAVFQEDAESRRFLERFLAVFQSGFDDLDAKVDQVADLFDPYRAPAKHLRWLAALVALGVEPTWPEEQLREQIKTAVTAYGTRGTPAGLTDAIRTYAGVQARILEHFRVRRWVRLSQAAPLDGTAPLWSRDFYQRLQVTSYSQVGRFRLTSQPEPPIEALDWGANRFSVFFQTDPYRVEEVRARVGRVVERDKPAHTEATLCPVLPRLRVGVQASLGVDAAVGSVSYLVLNQLATLSYDSILSCSREETTLRAMGSAVRPTLGVTTRLA